jgi:sugar phosphate isomerase/epimerase
MKTLRVLLLLLILLVDRRAEAELVFFAMDTIARGAPEEVAPQLKELGYAGIAGRLGDQSMAEAMRAAGLKFFGGYQVVRLDAQTPTLDPGLKERIDRMQGYDTAVWLGLNRISNGTRSLPKNAPEAMKVALREVRTIADYAQARGVRVALYPHAGFWLERVEEAVDLAERLNHPNVGVMLNLCHWLKMEGAERDPSQVLKKARPRLFFVTVNGADTGDTQKMPWNRLIQPLGSGTYDVAAFLEKLVASGYSGPVGFQGYGIQEDPRAVMAATMAAWRRMNPQP